MRHRRVHRPAGGGFPGHQVFTCIPCAIAVPAVHYGVLSAITAMIPLQILALAAAECRGMNVDQPVNLAKSVTVL
ncbi:MAG: hypothetical protein AAB402_03200 [Patescibacteria group bacterium]